MTEPTTLATDYLLALLALGCAWRLLRQPGRATRWWGAAFVALAVGSIAGGTHHGFAPVLGGLGNWITWKLTLWSIGIMSLLLLLALITSTAAGSIRRGLTFAALVQCAIYLAWTGVNDAFKWAIVDYAVALLAILGVGLFRGIVRRDVSGWWMVAGVCVTLVASAIQQSGFDPHPLFNHNDLYHVVEMGGVYLLYRGGLALRDV